MSQVPKTPLLQEVIDSLRERLKEVLPDSVDSGFMAWIYPENADLVKPILPSDFAVSNYSHVAQLSFLMELYPQEYASDKDTLLEGLTRTSQRSATISGVGPAPFCSDAVALLGVAVGAKLIGGDTVGQIKRWFTSILSKPLENLPDWKKLLINASVEVLSHDEQTALPYSHQEIPDMQLALVAKGFKHFPEPDFDQVYRSICQGAVFGDSEIALVSSRIAALHYLINHLPRISVSKPKAPEIAQVLSNLNNGFRRWPWEDSPKTTNSSAQKWDVQNEYHVQSLVYFLLAPLFPDIESEFYLENTGQLNSRADIGLPAINLIIEIKFLRANKNFQSILEEVAADATLYFKKDSVYKEKYSQMLVFLWDDSNRSQEYTTFKNGATSMPNIIDAVVISRPGIINRPSLIPKKR